MERAYGFFVPLLVARLAESLVTLGAGKGLISCMAPQKSLQATRRWVFYAFNGYTNTPQKNAGGPYILKVVIKKSFPWFWPIDIWHESVRVGEISKPHLLTPPG